MPQTHTLSLHDALPIYAEQQNHNHIARSVWSASGLPALLNASRLHVLDSAGKPDTLHTLRAQSSQLRSYAENFVRARTRSEEHTSELQSPMYIVCCLLL